MGKAAGLKTDWEGTFGAFCYAVRPDPMLVRSRYLELFMQSPRYRKRVSQLAAGTNINNLKRDHIESFELPRLDLGEQDSVVAAADKQLTRLDVADGSVEAAQRKLRTQRRAILHAAVTGRLNERSAEPSARITEILELREQEAAASRVGNAKYRPPTPPVGSLDVPPEWTVAALEQATSASRPICYGILKPRIQGEGTVPYVEVRDLRQGRIRGDLKRTSSDLDEEFKRSRLASGDVVIAIRGSYDRGAVVPDFLVGANISRDVARIVPLHILHPSFLSLYLQSPMAHRHFGLIARGSAVKGLNIGDLRSMPVPVPPFSEQLAIVDETERLLSLADDLAIQIEGARRRTENLRQSILHSAFSNRPVGVSV
ncbi:MAG: restriction endonuclease subunit S [Actinomycetota bacterium]